MRCAAHSALSSIARNAPHFFGIRLEEDAIQPLAKPIRHPFFKRIFVAIRKNLGAEITHQHQKTLPHAQLAQRIAEAQRIHDVFAIVVDAAQARARQKIVAQHFLPERFHLVHFGEEAMPADVHAITVEDFGARDAAHARAHLQHDRLDADLRQFIRRGQARRSAADNNHSFDCDW